MTFLYCIAAFILGSAVTMLLIFGLARAKKDAVNE